jgi:hypothetical protein
MSITQQDLDGFYQFASDRILHGGANGTLADLINEWHIQHGSSEASPVDVLAVKASLRDMEAGETGLPFHEFASEFRRRNNIPSDA